MANIAGRYVLDSSALIAFLWDEAGAQTVEDILVEEDAEVFMSVVNLGEVIYIVHRLAGEQTAAAVETKVFETPKLRVIDATWPRVKHAAGIKVDGRLSFADCFCVGLAQEKEAVLVTCDREFERLEQQGKVAVLWLPGGERSS
ncbi:MAG: type II toxin-antitoxin system VapC family toxin [Bacillota bacterium]|jgi:predicted nucleic acid-binding protein|nr:type II toxin-antitoxin system VapC family toxin [Candidatus Fermentithermobacillaceae bacterium]